MSQVAKAAPLTTLTDSQLIEKGDAVVRFEHSAGVELLEVLVEIDRRSAYLDQGYSSLFDYCTRRWRYSPSTASRQIAAARAMARFPLVARMLRDRRFTICGIARLAKSLTEENCESLLTRGAGRTFVEIEQLVAGGQSAPRIPDRVRVIGRSAGPRGQSCPGQANGAFPGPAAPQDLFHAQRGCSGQDSAPSRPEVGAEVTNARSVSGGEVMESERAFHVAGAEVAHAAGAHAAGARAVVAHVAVAHAAGAHAAAAQAAGAEAAVAHGAQAVGTRAVGTYAVGTHAEGTRAEGTRAEGTRAEGTHAVGTHAEGTHAGGTHAEGTHATGPHAASPGVARPDDSFAREPDPNELCYEIRFSASRRFAEKLERARAVCSNRANLESLFERALDDLLERRDPARRMARRKTRAAERGVHPRPRTACAVAKSSKRSTSSKPSKPPQSSEPPRSSGVAELPKSSEPLKPADLSKRSVSLEPNPGPGRLDGRGMGSVRSDGPGRSPGYVGWVASGSEHGDSGEVESRTPDAEGPIRSRHIPLAVRDAVFVRDEGRCTWCGPTGIRCEARVYLQFDHIVPFALGGSHSVANLRLRCGKHNRIRVPGSLARGAGRVSEEPHPRWV